MNIVNFPAGDRFLPLVKGKAEAFAGALWALDSGVVSRAQCSSGRLGHEVHPREKCARLMKAIKSPEIQVTSVHDVIAAGQERDLVQRGRFVAFPLVGTGKTGISPRKSNRILSFTDAKSVFHRAQGKGAMLNSITVASKANQLVSSSGIGRSESAYMRWARRISTLGISVAPANSVGSIPAMICAKTVGPGAHPVVGDRLQPDFLFDQRGRLAAQHVQTERGFDVAEAPFDGRVPPVKGGDRLVGIGAGVEQGRREHDLSDAEAGHTHAETHDAQGQPLRQLRPQGLSLGLGIALWVGPVHLVSRERTRLMSAHDHVDTFAFEQRDQAPAANSRSARTTSFSSTQPTNCRASGIS